MSAGGTGALPLALCPCSCSPFPSAPSLPLKALPEFPFPSFPSRTGLAVPAGDRAVTREPRGHSHPRCPPGMHLSGAGGTPRGTALTPPSHPRRGPDPRPGPSTPLPGAAGAAGRQPGGGGGAGRAVPRGAGPGGGGPGAAGRAGPGWRGARLHVTAGPGENRGRRRRRPHCARAAIAGGARQPLPRGFRRVGSGLALQNHGLC